MADFLSYVNQRKKQIPKGKGGSDRVTDYVADRTEQLMQGARRVPLLPPVPVKAQEEYDPELEAFNAAVRSGADIRSPSELGVRDFRERLPDPFKTQFNNAESTYREFAPPVSLQQINPLADSDMLKAGQGDPNAVARLQQRASEVTPSQQVQGRRAIQNRNSPVGQFIEPALQKVDWALYENPVGQFLSRLGYSGAEALGAAEGVKPSTGSKIGDIAADFGGEMAAMVAPLPGMPTGTTLASTPYQAADNLLSTNVGQRVVQAAGKALGGRTQLAEDLLRGSMAGAGQNVALSAMRNETDLDQLAGEAALGALLGGPLDAAVGAVGRGIGKRIGAKTATPSSQQPVQNVSSSQPANGLTENTPNIMKAAKDVGLPPRGTNAPSKIDNEEIPSFLLRREVPEQTKIELPNATEPAEAMQQNWYTDLFGDQGIGISATSSSKKIRQGPLTTEEQIVNSPLRNDLSGNVERVKAAGRAAYQNFVDMNAPLKRISRETYDKSIDATRANNIANTVISDKFVTPEGVVVGEGLSNIFNKVGRGQTRSFLDYIVLRHAKTRMARNEKVYAKELNMTIQKVDDRIKMYDNRHPEFSKLAAEWDQFNDNMLRVYGVNEGLISEASYRVMRDQNPNYAPMRRQFSTSEKLSNPYLRSGSSFSGQKAPIKEVSPTGSVRNIVDPRRSTIEATGAWVNSAMRNRVMQSLVKQVQANPDAMRHIAEIVPETAEMTQKSLKEINNILKEDGFEGLLENLNNDFDMIFKKSAQKGAGDNIVRAMINGQPVKVKVNDSEAAKALLGMGSDQSNIVLQMLGKLSDATKYGATGALAPMFAVKSLSMDIIQAIIQSKNPLQHFGDLGYAIISSVADTLPKNIPGLDNLRALAQDYRRVGGEYSAALRGEKKLKKSVRSMDRNPLLSPQNVANIAGKTLTAPFKVLNKVADVSENLNRMAAYRGEMRRLGWERTPENVMQAVNEAREITTNFSRKGSQSRTIESIVPYQNAAVQGMYRFARQFKKNPVKTMAVVGSAVIAPKFVEYMQFHNDEDYQKIPARERYRNLYVRKNENGTFTKVPLPPEYAALGAFMIDSLRYFQDEDPTAFNGAADAILNAYTPPLVTGVAQPLTQGGGLEQSITGLLGSTVLSPLVSTVANKDFAGRPIENMSLERNSRSQRYDERTSRVAKKLGELLDFSPKKIDYLLRSYGGDPARLLLPLTSDVGAGDMKSTVLKNFITDPQFSNNLANDFYAYKESLSQAYADNSSKGKGHPDWYDEELRKEITSTKKGSVSKRLSDLSDQKKEIQMNKSLSAKERTERLRSVQKQMNDIYMDVNAKMYEKGVPNK